MRRALGIFLAAASALPGTRRPRRVFVLPARIHRVGCGRFLFHPPMKLLLAPLFVATSVVAAVSTGSPFYGDPPDATHPWAIHDRNRPQPPRVEPGTFSTATQPGQPPSDAVVLFDGTEASLAKWEADTKPGEPTSPTKWVARDGALECVPKSGQIRSKDQFGDCQLHVEWASPKPARGMGQDRANSGIFLMGVFELQVLDSYRAETYADGQAGPAHRDGRHREDLLQPVQEGHRGLHLRPLRLIEPGRRKPRYRLCPRRERLRGSS